MGEQPIFATKAHVFQIDPNTKKKWLPASSQAISVAYYYDSTRNSYRIISVDGSKAVINSTITPSMSFTKTSQKFGQWSDTRANTVYGLGFSSEAELLKFIEKFNEVRELTKQAQASSNGGGDANEILVDGPDSPAIRTKVPSVTSSPQNNADVDKGDRRSTSSVSSLPGNPVEAQLKYENDRLKLALAQSSANAKKWEVELQTLKNNNARLTTALQESTTNVEEWKKQLAAYKEESARLKKRVTELEQNTTSSEQVHSIQKHLGEATDKVMLLEREKLKRNQEIEELTSKLKGLEMKESENKSMKEKVLNAEREAESLRGQVRQLEQQVADSKTLQGKEKQKLAKLQEQLGVKINELSTLHSQLLSSMKT